MRSKLSFPDGFPKQTTTRADDRFDECSPPRRYFQFSRLIIGDGQTTDLSEINNTFQRAYQNQHIIRPQSLVRFGCCDDTVFALNFSDVQPWKVT